MPKRSNDFQRLIALLIHVLEDAKVEESKEFPDPDNSEQREVDVYALLRGRWDGREIRVAVECVDRKRKRDTPWVEQMGMKYQRLGIADVVLLVSSTGFYRSAVEKANALGMRAITPTITKRNLSGHIEGSLEGGGIGGEFTMGLTVGIAEMEHIGINVYPNIPGTWIDTKFRTADGTELVDPMEFALKQIASDPDHMHAIYEGGESRYLGEHDEPTHEGEPLHILVTPEAGGTETVLRVTHVSYMAKLDLTNRGDMSPTEIGDFDGIPFATGTSAIGGEPARMVIAPSPDGQGFRAVGQVKYTVPPPASPESEG